ncbi:MAG: hypothetical protein OXT09_11255 [Myxococcales bacterium]|nr:hypothetical protein [Myxococcales bacterium]
MNWRSGLSFPLISMLVVLLGACADARDLSKEGIESPIRAAADRPAGQGDGDGDSGGSGEPGDGEGDDQGDGMEGTEAPTPPCGNGDEGCDPDNLGGETCESLGAGTGDLACDPITCTFDMSMCTEQGGGTGGTGGGANGFFGGQQSPDEPPQ